MGTGSFGDFGNTSGSNNGDNLKYTIEKNSKGLSQRYPLTKGGYFGEKGKNCRIIKTKTPKMSSIDFYLKLAKGGKTEKLKGGGVIKTQLDDGTIVVHRMITSTKGSPAVDIKVIGHSSIKTQKIHFIKGEE